VLAQMTGTTIDDYFEALARLLPGGFGGLTTSVVWLKHPEEEAELRRTTDILETCSSGSFPYLAYLHSAPIRKGDYDWVELRTWYRALLDIRPFTANSADMDEGSNRLAFSFGTDAELNAFRARALAAGVPANAFYLSIAPPATPVDRLPPADSGTSPQ
jgi:hypothetical protein